MAVVMGHVVFDGADQLRDTPEGASANSLMLEDAAIGFDDFEELLDSIETGLDAYRERSPELSDADRCLWGTMDGVFSRLTLHGADERSATVGLRHTLERW